MKKIALIGSPVSHSLSPAMHNAAFSFCGLPFTYESIDIAPEQFSQRWSELLDLEFVGFNVTIPHKNRMFQALSHLSEKASLVQAVNTVALKDGVWRGYNTDVEGFLKPLFDLTQKKTLDFEKVLILGAGGSAQAVAVALASKTQTKHIAFWTRTPSRARQIQKRIQKHFPHLLCTVDSKTQETVRTADMIVNTTPVGLFDEDFDIFPDSWIKKASLCYDLIYTKTHTSFLKKALKRDCLVLNGLEMLLWQGAYAWKIWTGKEAPVDVMRETLHQNMERT